MAWGWRIQTPAGRLLRCRILGISIHTFLIMFCGIHPLTSLKQSTLNRSGSPSSTASSLSDMQIVAGIPGNWGVLELGLVRDWKSPLGWPLWWQYLRNHCQIQSYDALALFLLRVSYFSCYSSLSFILCLFLYTALGKAPTSFFGYPAVPVTIC